MSLPPGNDIKFHFVQAPHELTSLPFDFEAYAGSGPHMRFIEHPQWITMDDVIERIAKAPSGESAEMIWRHALDFYYSNDTPGRSEFIGSIGRSLALLNSKIDEEGPFDGLIGYCEGASFGATLILDRLRKESSLHAPQSFKCALFFSGYAPFAPDGSKVILADEYGQIFNFPTCHVIGSDDALIDGAMALLNLCDSGQATVIEGGSGHLMPQDSSALRAVSASFLKLVDLAQQA